MTMFCYRAYGLTISSALEIPEFSPGNGGAPSVTIRTGAVAEAGDPQTAAGGYCQAAPDRFLLSVPGVARFLVLEGREVVVERAGPEGRIRPFLFGSIFGVLLRQRGVLPLHASAIAMPRGAAIFAGPQGHGKSTLAAEFWRRGYRVLADDVCAVTAGPLGLAQAWPGYPGLNLHPDAVEHVAACTGLLDPACRDDQKRRLILRGFSHDSVPVSTVYVLHHAPECDQPCLTPLKGFEKLEEIAASTHGRRVPVNAQYLEQVRALAAQARVVRVVRPQALSRLGELADRLEEDFA
jgi:hypothetical protein